MRKCGTKTDLAMLQWFFQHRNAGVTGETTALRLMLWGAIVAASPSYLAVEITDPIWILCVGNSTPGCFCQMSCTDVEVMAIAGKDDVL